MTDSAHGPGQLVVRLRSANGGGVVRIEGRLQARIEEVWVALTDPSHLVDWYGEIVGELQVGGSYRGRLFASGWEGVGRVEVCEPPRRLTVASKEPDAPAEDRTEVTLTPDGDRTVLVVEQSDLPLNVLWAYGAGLQIHVEDLEGHLDGRQRSESLTRFDALASRYQSLAADIV